VKSGLYEYGVTYHGMKPHDQRRESVFFTNGLVATVGIDGYNIDIYAEGNTRLNYANGDDIRIFSTPDDFIYGDLETDAKLLEIQDDEDYYWVNNNWFDLYINGEHLDQVTHTIDEAIESAKAIVAEHIVNVCFIENEGKPILQQDAILVLN
jgi:hypothetical protein